MRLAPRIRLPLRVASVAFCLSTLFTAACATGPGDSVEPEASEPNTSEPDTSEPETSEPETPEPAAEPEAAPDDGGVVDDAGTEPEPTPEPTPEPPSGCSADNPLVGQRFPLTERAHDVSGTLYFVDDCTLRIEDFTFDGGGIVVQVYVAENGDYRNGIPISEDLLGRRFDGEDFDMRLPAAVNLDTIDSLSVWCVGVGISFGDTRF